MVARKDVAVARLVVATEMMFARRPLWPGRLKVFLDGSNRRSAKDGVRSVEAAVARLKAVSARHIQSGLRTCASGAGGASSAAVFGGQEPHLLPSAVFSGQTERRIALAMYPFK